MKGFDGNDDIILTLIINERERQYDKWGDQTHTFEEWKSIFDEEFAEFKCKVVCGYDNKEALKELIECIAVLCAWAKDLNREK